MITVQLTEDEADLAMRSIAWVGQCCDSQSRAYADGTVIFACRHTRDRCNVLAKKFADALKEEA
jgi:hypothetical protein